MKQEKLQNLQFTAESYEKKYKPHMELFESSIVGRHVGRSASHVNALGQMLDRWAEYKTMKEANGSISSMGQAPMVAAGVITASFSSNAMNVLANVQVLPEQSGLVYFEETKASTTKGNVTAGQLLLSPNVAPEVYPVGYSSNTVAAVLGQTVSGTKTYSISSVLTTSQLPIVPRTATVAIALAAGTEVAIDDGQGNLIGKTFGGTISYSTGAVVLNLSADPASAVNISIGYGQDIEVATSEVEVEVDLKSITLNAKMYALKANLGIFKQFTLENRFGIDGKERLATRLTQELNNQLTNEAIDKIVANAQGNISWDRNPGAYISKVEKKLEFLDIIAGAENNLINNAGRGKITCIVAAPNIATLIKTLPGFVPSGVVGPGATIFGTLDDMTIVRAPQLAAGNNNANANCAYVVYRGEEAFDGAAVYAPYMPIVSIEDVPSADTILMKRNGVAHMADIAVTSKNFISKITVTDSTT